MDHSTEILEITYKALSTAAHVETQLRGSEAWLRDNFYVVQDQVREIRQDLPRKYYEELPKLVSGPWQGYPRVYQLALEFVPRTASRFDAEGLVRFVSAYQETVPLSIGEIWAMPIMLRFALVETLRRLAERVMTARRQRADAVRFASELDEGTHVRRARSSAPSTAAAIARSRRHSWWNCSSGCATSPRAPRPYGTGCARPWKHRTTTARR